MSSTIGIASAASCSAVNAEGVCYALAMSIQDNRSSEERAADIAAQQASVNARLPPDALELINDPRVEPWKQEQKHRITGALTFQPAEPVRTESPYLKIERGHDARPDHNASWVNKPNYFFDRGGRGFKAITERPRIEQARPAPHQLFHLWEFAHCFVASPDITELLMRVDPDAIVTLPIDWVFSDGQGLDGYVFLDFVHKRHVYDYKRSTVYVELRNGVVQPRLGIDRALRDDIPTEVHIVRDAYHFSEVFVSRFLAEQIHPLAHRELAFSDVHTRRQVKFPPPRSRHGLLARLKPAEVVEEDASMPLRRRINLRIMPLLQTGAFAEAEATLVKWMAAEPTSPYHIISDLQITNDPRDCAEYFDRFYERGSGDYGLGAVYTEMNGFVINPDLWFCDAFGFDAHGGTDNFDWLGSFGPATDEHYVIDGLEDLQRVFLEERTSRPDRQRHADAHLLAEALVIVKFQRFLQSAQTHMKKLNCPLLASAHDYIEFIVEIRPRGDARD